MRIDVRKLEITMAQQNKSVVDTVRESGLSSTTVTRIKQGYAVGTKTAGRLAKALGVPVEALLVEEGARQKEEEPCRN